MFIVVTRLHIAAFEESLNSSSSFLGVHGGPALDPECFQGAYFAFRRLTDQLTSLKSLGVAVDASPLHVCPVCSPQPDEGIEYPGGSKLASA